MAGGGGGAGDFREEAATGGGAGSAGVGAAVPLVVSLMLDPGKVRIKKRGERRLQKPQ